ncbi:MAG: hypothetical protein Fur0020_15160 [Thermodesulfovibrionia bacterium]
MIRGIILILLSFVGISGLVAKVTVAETTIDPIHAAADLVAKVTVEVTSYFPSVNGVVKDVEDGYANILIESSLLLKKGTRLSVFREGEPFYHPVTKEIIGRTETLIGRVEVIEKGDGFYRCSIINGDIKGGDLVRITSSRVKIAFFQDRDADWTLSEALYKSLKDTNRFEIIDAYTKDYEPQGLSRIAKGLNAEVAFMFSTPLKEGKRSLNIRLYWAEDSRLIDEIEIPIMGTGSLGYEKTHITINPFDTEPWRAYDIEKGELIAIGDVDGDGLREIIVSDGRDIRIYSIKDEPREVWFIKGGADERHLSLDVLDLNNNGRAEIFVTSISGMEGTITVDESRFKSADIGNIRSFIIEYDPLNGYRRIKDGLPYFFRVANSRLLMQDFSINEIFAGPVYEGVWRDGEYIKDRPLKLPNGIDIYSFTFVDWKNNGEVFLTYLDEDGYLNLSTVTSPPGTVTSPSGKEGEVLWRSKKSYGRHYLTFEIKTHSIVNPVKRWGIKGKLIPIRTEKGQEVLIVKRNPILSRVPGLGYSDADVYAIWWNGESMDERLIMEGLSGTITDYALEGADLFLLAHGGLFSFLKKAVKGDLSSGGRIYYYKFIVR